MKHNHAFTIWTPAPGYYSDSFNPCIPDNVRLWQSHCGLASDYSPGFRGNQPDWEFAGNLGDADPYTYGGAFVYRDRTGVYEPECAYWSEPEEGKKAHVYRFTLEYCTFINGVLSDNAFHKDYPVWFSRDLASVADTCGMDLDELRDLFLSGEPLELARAYLAVGYYHGFENLDSYPDRYTSEELQTRYPLPT